MRLVADSLEPYASTSPPTMEGDMSGLPWGPDAPDGLGFVDPALDLLPLPLATTGPGGAAASAAAALPPPAAMRALVQSWLASEAPVGDVAACLAGDAPAVAELQLTGVAMLAGRPFVDILWSELGCTIQWLPIPQGREVAEGEDGDVHGDLDPPKGETVAPAVDMRDLPPALPPLPSPEAAPPAAPPLPPHIDEWTDGAVAAAVPVTVARVRGPARALLRGERLAAGILRRASSVATAAARLAEIGRGVGWEGRLAGETASVPAWPAVEAHGLRVGGAAEVAAMAGADAVRLAGFEASAFRDAAARLRVAHGREVRVEGSGGLTPEALPSYFCNAVDVLAVQLDGVEGGVGVVCAVSW
ncbi:hypothetical protein I4F81_005900 [Pyropia yezoensis]|uniref:Uncharacterized protein n=1 Tax=Pyropia yezoensis TaxID=2788 RepID=A0ACC3BZK6_PYRYE|nr:hypothetical protein I4F81_005900 [Neopyropia yezoensis]